MDRDCDGYCGRRWVGMLGRVGANDLVRIWVGCVGWGWGVEWWLGL